MSSIRAGEQYEKAYDFEKSNYTVYRTNSHECGARVFVPDIQVMDNCSGLESVKAVLHDRAGNFERKVAMELTDMEIADIGGDRKSVVEGKSLERGGRGGQGRRRKTRHE